MRRPNLLFIFTDEQRQDTLRVYGNRTTKTPRLDGLAGDSVVFNNCYVSQPVCGPSRASIMTGTYPHTNGYTHNNAIPLSPEYPTLAEMLPDGVYECGFFGKWHLGPEIIGQRGFEKNWVSTEDAYHPNLTDDLLRSRHSDYHYFLKAQGLEADAQFDDGFKWFSRRFCLSLPKELTKPAFTAMHACDFIEKNRDRPFAAYVSFAEPHPPFLGPFDWMYDPDELQFSLNFMVPEDETKPMRSRLFSRRLGQMTEEWYRENIARYYGLVSLVDYYVGEVLDRLADCGLDDDTIVVFTSDHGDMLGNHMMRAKRVMYEESVKVPLLMRVPQWGTEQRFIDAPVSNVDLVPTLLSLLGCPLPDHLEGRDIAPYVTGKGVLDCQDVFIEYNPKNEYDRYGYVDNWILSEDEMERLTQAHLRTVVTADGWKLNLCQGDLGELYNLCEDPCEMVNLYARAEYRQVAEELTARIRAWQEQTRDTVELCSLVG